MLRRSLGVLSLFALLAAACGGGGSGGAGKNITCPTVTNGTAAAANGEVTVCAFDIRYDAKTITMTPAGALKVTLVNKGAIPHTFEIDGQNFELKVSGHNDVKTGTVTLAAGTYNFKCTIPGHAANGMAGKIVVS